MHSAGDKSHNAKHYTQHNDNHKRCHNNVRSESERCGQILTVQPCTQQNQQHHNYVGDSHCVKHDRLPPLIEPRVKRPRGFKVMVCQTENQDLSFLPSASSAVSN